MKYAGFVLVLLCTFFGIVLAAGFEKAVHLFTSVILPSAPGEFLIIMGCAVCAYIIANTPESVKYTLKYFKAIKKPSAYSKDDYIELFSALYILFKMAKMKGWLALEQHIENPHESELFGRFPGFQHNHHAVTFLADYLRIISLGNENPHQLGDLMDSEIEAIEHHELHPGHAMQTMADGIPALGIVAAVLGVIKTMASITEPPEVLGHLIGGALVGTFLGVWLSYAFVAPIAGAMTQRAQSEIIYFKVMKAVMIAYLNGIAPQVAVEFGRKLLPHDIQPTFQELETKLNELPPPTA